MLSPLTQTYVHWPNEYGTEKCTGNVVKESSYNVPDERPSTGEKVCNVSERVRDYYCHALRGC